MFTFAISCLTTSNLPWFLSLTFKVPMQYCSYSIGFYLHPQTHPQLSTISALAQPLPSFRSYFSALPSRVLEIHWGAYLLVSYLFAFSYCSWGSWGKNTGVVCHYFLQWTSFCQNSPPWPIHLRWPCIAWLITSLTYLSVWPMRSIF